MKSHWVVKGQRFKLKERHGDFRKKRVGVFFWGGGNHTCDEGGRGKGEMMMRGVEGRAI